MATRYRIEIDVLLEDSMKATLIRSARHHYSANGGAHRMDGEKDVMIPAEEFVEDTEDALLELLEVAFRSALPNIEPDAFRCRTVLATEGEGRTSSGTQGRVYGRVNAKGVVKAPRTGPGDG
ncbi:MAG: hypothetical protein ABI833_23780 [Acidobacteriota bacterium]